MKNMSNYPQWIRDLDDDHKLYQRYANKRINAKKNNINFELSFEEYCSLVLEANLKSSQLGFTGQNYVLARYRDEGSYVYGNCRFITQFDNIQERKTSEAMLKAQKTNLALYKEMHPEVYTKGTDAYNHWLEALHNCEYSQRRREQAQRRKEERDSKKDKRHCGEHNSSFGTYWITNGTINKKWSDKKGEIPETFYRGRVNCFVLNK